ncbi:short-chain dehydrogenase [Paenibacillus sp. MWE-103]|uniref:Short-chain dehydrogenase n=1 Tax=Paenibacillus artemisiicola TaxID=1172618 RepID=A0ABS3WHW3_9BACL|nr:short-chain dehydrogenase [Paenibacillus artemisiicola]
MKPTLLKDEKLSYVWNTTDRIIEAISAIENNNLVDGFYISNGKNTRSSSMTHDAIEYLADYILECENLTTKMNEYNVLDHKRLQEVELFEQGLPLFKIDGEDFEVQLTDALINKKRLVKHEDPVHQKLKGDYAALCEGACLTELWCYQIIQNEHAKSLVEGCYGLIHYYRTKGLSKFTRHKIKELIFEEIGSIVRSNTKFETVKRRSGQKANKKQSIESLDEMTTNKYCRVFKMLVADKKAVKDPVKIIPFVDFEALIEMNISSRYLNYKDIETIELIQKHFNGNLIECLKVGGRYKTNKRRIESLIRKLEKNF